MTSPLLDHVAPPLPEASQNETSTWNRLGTYLRTNLWPRQPTEAESPTPSGYLTLIPLSDARLQPRDTRLTAAFLVSFALLVAGAVFLTTPRSVTVGEISVAPDRMSWNTTKASYQLKLVVSLPLNNPNYLGASVEGDLRVLFYEAEAGRTNLKPTALPPRALPKTLSVGIDASDVPPEYILSILSQCSTFPEVLVFFLKGRLTSRFLWMRQDLSNIDTYFMIDCQGDGIVNAHEIGSGLGKILEKSTEVSHRSLKFERMDVDARHLGRAKTPLAFQHKSIGPHVERRRD